MCEWTGTTGLPGVSVFYGQPGAPGAVADLVTFFEAVKALIPTDISISVPTAGDLIEDSDGSLAGTWTNSAGAVIDCTGSGSFAAGVGARVVWRTNGIRGRRRVRGSTFLCPLITTVYESNGTLTSTALTTLQNASLALAAGGNLIIWSRPTSVGAGDGDSNAVLSRIVPDRVTSLRTRRY